MEATYITPGMCHFSYDDIPGSENYFVFQCIEQDEQLEMHLMKIESFFKI